MIHWYSAAIFALAAFLGGTAWGTLRTSRSYRKLIDKHVADMRTILSTMRPNETLLRMLDAIAGRLN